MSQSPPNKSNRPIIGIALSLVVLNLGVTLAGLWQWLWWMAALIDFVLLVLMAEHTGKIIPARFEGRYERGLAILFPLLLIAGWEAVVAAGILNPDWFPPPSKILEALWQLLSGYDRFNKSTLLLRVWMLPQRIAENGLSGAAGLLEESHILITLMRVFVGFVIGAIPAILIGVIMGMSRTVRAMLDSTLSAFYVLPKIAIFPIMMLVFPNPFGEGPKIAVVAISAFFLVAINTMVGVRDIEPVYLEAGRNYGANRRQLLRHVIIPGAMPVIFAGLRLALGTALIVIIAIEFVRAKKGVGFLTFYYWEILAPEKMYAGLIVVMILGVLLTLALKWLEKRIMPWRREETRTPSRRTTSRRTASRRTAPRHRIVE